MHLIAFVISFIWVSDPKWLFEVLPLGNLQLSVITACTLSLKVHLAISSNKIYSSIGKGTRFHKIILQYLGHVFAVQ